MAKRNGEVTIKHFFKPFRNFVNFLIDPDTRCLFWLAGRNLVKKDSSSADKPPGQKETRTRAAKVS